MAADFVDSRGMNPEEDALWHRLQGHQIGPADVALTFTARLAHENRWSPEFADRVIGEYKRFCYLAVRAGHEVTPSDQVDQVWHLHLTYSRDYWQLFCPEVLGCELHHGPTAGGPLERGRYFEQYAETLRSYEVVFGPPPEDIWPAAATRFGRDPQRVRIHPSDYISLSDWRAYAIIAIAALVLIAVGFGLGRIG